MKKAGKSNLDEMQSQKLLQLEEHGFWAMFWALFVSVAVQFIAGGSFKQAAGEMIVLLIGSVYIAASSLRNGIWTKTSPPTRKGNAVASIIPAVLLFVIYAVRLARNNKISTQSMMAVAAAMASVYIICFAALEILRAVYNKYRARLDSAGEENGEG